MQYRFLSLEEFVPYAPQILALAEKALVYSAEDWTLSDAMEQYAKGESVLFAVIDEDAQRVVSMGMGSFVLYPKHTVFFVTLSAGTFDAVHLDRFIALVKPLGVRYIEAKVRPSIARLLRRRGFSSRHIIVRREL
jgi:hypothetical protein